MNNAKRFSISIASLSILCICLCVISFALGMVVYEVKDNSFQTGGIEIDLNGGKPVITADEILFKPGMTVEKDFYIRNEGSWAVYYKLYFSEISGNLGEALDVTILDKDGNTLLSGTLADMTQDTVPAMEDELEVGQRRDMRVRFHFPEEKKNEYESGTLEFKLSTIAVQTKNNATKEFE